MIVDLFGKFAGAEIRFIKKLEADAARFRKSRGGHLQTGLGDLIGCDQDSGASVGQAILEAAFVQFGHQSARVLIGEAGK